MDKKIYIQRPYITRENDLFRINALVTENGVDHLLFAEVEEQYAKYLCKERADAFLYLVLPVALREGYDIYSEVPVTENFLHNINEILIPHLVMGDNKIHPIHIFAQTENELIGGSAISTAISCGVDSLYTVKQYTDNKYSGLQLTHLFIASVNAELWDTKNGDLHQWEKEHKIQFDRYNVVSNELQLPLVKIYTNFFWYICSRDWKVYHHLYVHHYITLATVLILKKLWKVYFFSSASPYTIFDLKDNATQDTDRHELLSMHVLSTQDFLCFSGGIKADRIKKTLELADYPLAQKTLHPCHGNGEKNCSNPTCHKCLRALLVYDYYDKLDNMGEVFDIERYRRERKHYLWRLVQYRENEFMKKLYDMFCEKFPEDMKSVEENYNRFILPVPRSEYNLLKQSYDFSLELIGKDNLKGILVKFFEIKGIHTLYCAGFSLLGKKIVEMISKSIKCHTYKDSTVIDCDAALILDTNEKAIKTKKKILYERGAQYIYDLNDLKKHIKGCYNHEG